MRILLAPLVLAFVPFAAACSSFLDLGGNDDPAPAAPPAPKAGEGASQATPSALTDYCSARKSYADACGAQLDACQIAEGKECLLAFSIYREEYTKALTTCSSGFASSCSGDAASDAKENCLADERDKLAPTAAMTTLAADLCETCPSPSGDACPGEKFFFHGRRLPNGGVSVSGQGAIFDMYTDDVVAKIRAACLSAAKGSSCWPAFYACVDAKIDELTPSSVKQACAVNAGPGDGATPAPTTPSKP